jgi:GTPase SAR1 family protein
LRERRSFEDLTQWLTTVHELCDPNAVTTIIGNKTDLPDRAITPSEAQSFAERHELSYFETSALAGDNIREAFHRTAAAILKKNPGKMVPLPTAIIRTSAESKQQLTPCC